MVTGGYVIFDWIIPCYTQAANIGKKVAFHAEIGN